MSKSKTEIDPIKQLKIDARAGVPKREAFSKYVASGSDIFRGSMTLAMSPDRQDIKNNRWLVILMLSLYWLPILALYIASAIQGNYSVIFGHFFWPTLVTYFLIRNSAISYYVFIYVIAHEVYVAFNSHIDHPLFLPFVVIYCAILIAIVILTKLRLYPYQSFFHQRKNEDGTYVYTGEAEVIEKKKVSRKKKR